MRSSAKRVRYSSDVNIVCDGNSLTEGVGGTPYTTYLSALPPLSGQCTVSNSAIGGQTTANMTSNAADIDAAFVSGKTNILIAWEGANSIYGGKTAEQAITDLQSYISRVLSAHQWKIVVMTCLPRQTYDEALSASVNSSIDSYNATLRNSFRGIGISALVDVRKSGSPFNISGYTDADFSALVASSGLWAVESPHVHLNGPGYQVIAQMVADTLRQLRLR